MLKRYSISIHSNANSRHWKFGACQSENTSGWPYIGDVGNFLDRFHLKLIHVLITMHIT